MSYNQAPPRRNPTHPPSGRAVTMLHDVVIEMEGPGKGRVFVDGMKLCVKDFTLRAGVDEVTELNVTLKVKTVNFKPEATEQA
ncbi:hypothetical protein ACOTBX_10395 [Achromobacter xylosoxidans]